ncbi:MAG TPA: pilus assembly protein PilM [Clostridiaceae bacterium]|nr:pilus assembly protein PilM [Clostridiaceae bacterium]
MRLFNRGVVGIDISCSQIRFVELRGNINSPVIQNMGSIYVSDEVVKNGKVINSDKFKAALEELWKQYKIKSKDIVLGISNSDVIMRFVSLPKMPVSKLSNFIKFQASDFIPVNIEDYELDYTIVSEGSNESGPYYNVLLVAARKKMLYEYINTFLDMNLYIKDIKSSVLVMDNTIPKEYRNGVSVVVNITPEACNLLIVNNKLPAFARTILFGDMMSEKVDVLLNYKSRTHGDKIISDKHELNHLLKYSHYEKATLNSTVEFSNGNIAVLEKEDVHEIDIDDIANDIVSFIGGEIASSISYFQSQNRELTINKIFLLGGSCFDRAIYYGLAKLIGSNAYILKPYENMFNTLSKKKNIEDFEPAEYAIALSLAMHGLGG